MILMHKINENGKVKIIIKTEKIHNNSPKHDAEALMRDGNQIKNYSVSSKRILLHLKKNNISLIQEEIINFDLIPTEDSLLRLISF